uniref:GATOR complex protein NPRL3 n=1 Tax=Heligmosomoides polygyrus TaxID=6339 RepID=A0A183G0P9_HELPZ
LGKVWAKKISSTSPRPLESVFVDNFIEVGFCVQSRAFAHAHLTPKNRAEIDRIVKRIRPYHGILLLEDVWPSPDANPSVTLLLKHCEPDRSILDMSTASGIPLLQVFLIVRHLLLWARAVVVYPLCNTNVYSSATYPKPLKRYISLFSQQFGSSFHLANALAQFDPPCTLGEYLNSRQPLADQQNKAKVIVALLRHQLIMQVILCQWFESRLVLVLIACKRPCERFMTSIAAT